ncbi:condensation domain-containing protein, partial [Nocardia sp. NPDC051981]|uniref:condensation domain-containing protein n=1 Tax=Nocardia sp. NPDC051981 TaxID=3155417 RepID=UPI00341A27E6
MSGRTAGEGAVNDKYLPLTAAQYEIWMATQLDPNSPKYHVGEYLEIEGLLDPKLAERAARQVVSEAEALRARFVEFGDTVLQYVDDDLDWEFPIVDFSNFPDPALEAERWMASKIGTALSPERDKLFYFALLRLAPDKSLWYHSFHHLLIDGMGMSIVARRVAELYTAFATGIEPRPSGFKSLRMLIGEDREYRNSKSYDRDRNFWMGRLAGIAHGSRVLGNSATTGQSVIAQSGQFEEKAWPALLRLAESLNVGYPAILIAAAGIMLHRLTGERDIVLGLPVSARSFSEFAGTPGMVSNIVPIRLTVCPGMSIGELIYSTSDEVINALRHQRYRAEDIARDLGVDGGLDGLFGFHVNFMRFNYSNFFNQNTSVHNLSIGPIGDLALAIYDRADVDGLYIDLLANGAVHSQYNTTSHHELYMRLIRTLAVAADPGCRVGAIDVLGEDERRRVLVDWNSSG